MSHTAIPTHMEILGVNWGASAQAVKDAWRKAAKAAHPDVAGDASTERMARINAAYEALKDGVPSQEEAQRAEAKPSWQSSSQSAPPRRQHSIDLAKMVVDEDMQRDWRNQGYRILRQHKRHSRIDRILSKILPGRSELIIHVPTYIRIPGGGIVEIVLDAERLHEGPNHIAIPHLVPVNGRLRGTGDITLQIISSKDSSGYIKRMRMKDMDNQLLPFHNGLKVYLSTKY